MIPAPDGIFAAFEQTGNGDRKYFTYEPVVAFDDEGFALTVDSHIKRRLGSLVRAVNFDNFAGLSDAREHTRHGVAVPAPPETYVVGKDSDTGGIYRHTVVAYDEEGFALCSSNEGPYLERALDGERVVIDGKAGGFVPADGTTLTPEDLLEDVR